MHEVALVAEGLCPWMEIRFGPVCQDQVPTGREPACRHGAHVADASYDHDLTGFRVQFPYRPPCQSRRSSQSCREGYCEG